MPIDANVLFETEFSLPEDIRVLIVPGDYYSFQLPAQININLTQNYPLLDIENVQYAVAHISTSGLVTITFTEALEHYSEISGNFGFSGKLDKEAIGQPGETVIGPPEGEILGGTTIVVKPATQTSIKKTGSLDSAENPNYVFWTVDINHAMDRIENAVVTDVMPEGLTYESVAVYKVDVDLDGLIVEGSEQGISTGFTNLNGLITFTDTIEQAYRLVYTARIDDAAKPDINLSGDVTFLNEATLSGDNFTLVSDEDDVTASYTPALQKETTNYNPKTETYDWEVVFNARKDKIIKEQAKLEDTIGNTMKLEGTPVLYTQDQDGEEVVLGTDKYALTPKLGGAGFDVEFYADVDYVVILRYQTKVVGEIDEDTPIDNTVISGTGGSVVFEDEAKSQGVIKYAPLVNYQNKTLSWMIDVNNSNYLMKNFYITDSLSRGQILDQSSVVVTELGSPNTVLERGEEYTFNMVSASSPQSFTITFAGDYLETSSTFRITYTTSFDGDAYQEHSLDEFGNVASAGWIAGSDSQTRTPIGENGLIPNDKTIDNGSKTG
ncbi:MAG: collagen binding domain-containing protein, partial [Christensenellales bacterium]